MEEPNKTEQVSWNLSATTAAEIATHLARASEDYKSGRLEKCFYNLKLIKNRVIQNLNAEERQSLKMMEEKISQIISFVRITVDADSRMDEKLQEKIKHISKGKKHNLLLEIDNYNERIMDLLQKYGFLFQKKDDRTKMIA